MFFPKEEYEARWNKIYKLMDENKYEAAVVWSRSGGTADRWGNCLYIANFVSTASGQDLDNNLKIGAGFSAIILESGKEPLLITDDEPQQGQVATNRVQWADDVVSCVSKHLRQLTNKKVALVGSDILPMKYASSLFEAKTNLIVDDRLIDRVRMIKSSRELDVQREGGEIVSRAMTKLVHALRTGKSEAESASVAAAEIIKSGGSYHYIPISHGDWIDEFSRNPLTGYSLDVPKAGDMVRAYIYGPIWQGYWFDPGRTFVVGPSTNLQKELIGFCIGIVETLIKSIKPGVTTSLDIARLGENLKAEACGTHKQPVDKWPIYGHGNGLYWDLPEISTAYTDEEIVLVPGMTLGIEAVLTFNGVGSAGYEQNLIVTEFGTEILTTTPAFF